MILGRMTAALAATAVLVSAAALSGCRPADDVEISLDLDVQTVSADAATRQIKVNASGEWSLTLENTSWASLHFFGGAASQSLNGNGSDDIVILDYEENTSEQERVCTLVLISSGLSKTYSFTQIGKEKSDDPEPSVNPSELKSDPVPQWMELPAFDEESGLYFISHTEYTDVRNFSFAWDLSSMVSRWVAYPMGEWAYPTSGRVGRNEVWAYDPKLPKNAQPNLFDGSYKDDAYYWSGYERGHQLPSDHRQHNLRQNIQTFYGTNMIPQPSDFNGKIWANLESKVRSWSLSVDTLYVVTGCIIGEDAKIVYDADKSSPKQVKVPSHCFKALLAYSGASMEKRKANPGLSDNGYYTATAFIFENRAYSDGYMNHRITVDELEKITGFDFFHNLPDGIEKTVEAQTDSWWEKYE